MKNKKEEKKLSKKDLIKMLLNKNIVEDNEDELIDMLVDTPIAIDVDKQEEAKKTIGDKVADVISEKAGSWGFIIIFTMFLIFWIFYNTKVLPEDRAIDPYPFILLNLLLSCIAALQAPIIMMSQNRQAKKDSLRTQCDYKNDLKSELILEEVYERIESIEKTQNKILRKLEAQEEKKKK